MSNTMKFTTSMPPSIFAGQRAIVHTRRHKSKHHILAKTSELPVRPSTPIYSTSCLGSQIRSTDAAGHTVLVSASKDEKLVLMTNSINERDADHSSDNSDIHLVDNHHRSASRRRNAPDLFRYPCSIWGQDDGIT